MPFVNLAMTIIAAGLAIPVAVLFIETLAAILLPTKPDEIGDARSARGRVAVLVPAHNESTGIRSTIADIRVQLRVDDTLLVVADNCADDTSSVARSAGAEVIERNDLSKIGKGYALDWGLRHLSARPPEIVIVIDADCRVAAGSIDRLARTCAVAGRPAQSLDLMKAPEHSRVDFRVAEFAWRVKNWIRPLGLRALGLPCQLMGTGMAFPWPLISTMSMASSETVEDLRLGIDLALLGHPPTFCPLALVTSEFPLIDAAALNQRERWEHGHIRMILTAAPRLIWQGLAQRKLDVLAMGLDLAVPPLTLLMLLSIATAAISSGLLICVADFSALAFVMATFNFALLMATVSICWLIQGRDILPPRAFFALFVFAAKKLVLYRGMMSHKRPLEWICTGRERR